jgi:hypothetical protein
MHANASPNPLLHKHGIDQLLRSRLHLKATAHSGKHGWLRPNARKLLEGLRMAGRYFRVSTVVTTAIEIGRIVGGLFSRDQRADRKEIKRRQKKDAALLHRFKTQDSDRARAAAALGAAARSADKKERKKPSSPEMK